MIEYAEGGQIIQWIEEEKIFKNPRKAGFYDEDELRKIFRELVAGLDYCKEISSHLNVIVHLHNIVHRDIKPENILISGDGNIKLADFGVSTIVSSNDTLMDAEGTNYFMPPEANRKDEQSGGYSGKAADIWSLGVTFYALAYFQMPFLADDLLEFFDLIQQAE